MPLNLKAFTKTIEKPKSTLNLEAFKIEEPKIKKINKLPEFLGGGSFNVGLPGELIKTERGYAGIEAPGEYREHIFPVSLGGTSKEDNINVYGKDLGQKKSDYENEIIKKYKSGKVSLNEARGLVLQKYRQLVGLEPEQGIASNLWGGIKDTFLKPIETIKKSIQTNPQTIKNIKELEETFKTPASQATIRNISSDFYKEIKNNWDNAVDKISNAALVSKKEPLSKKTGKTLEAWMSLAGLTLSPITATFEASKNLPVVNSIVSLSNLPLSISADISSNITNEGLNVLIETGKIKQETAENLRQGLNEISNLASQIVIGGKLFKNSKEFKDKKIELENKYGKKDADTIIKKSEEKASIEKTTKPEQIIKPKIKKELNLQAFSEKPKIEKKQKLELTKEDIKNLNKETKSNYKLAEKLPPVEENVIRVYKTTEKPSNGTIKKGEYVDTNLIEHISRGNNKETKIYQDIPIEEFKNKFELKRNGIAKVKEDIQGNIYNEFEKPLTYKKIEFSEIKTPEIKVSKLAQKVEEKAIQKKLTQGFEDLPEYTKIDVKEQSRAAREYLSLDKENAIKVARGEKLPPEGILPESIFTAVENYAIKNKDVKLLQDLARSNLTTEATGMGQRIRLLAERMENSPVKSMKEVIRNREKFIESKNNKKISELIKDEKSNIKKELKKSKPTKDSWVEFISEITC